MTSHVTSLGAQLKQECCIQAIITHTARHQELPQHQSNLVKGVSNYVLVGTSIPELRRWTAISKLTDTLHLFNTTQGLVTHTPNNQNEILLSLATWCHANLSRDVRHNSVWHSVQYLAPTSEPIQFQPLAQHSECAELCHGYYIQVSTEDSCDEESYMDHTQMSEDDPSEEDLGNDNNDVSTWIDSVAEHFEPGDSIWAMTLNNQDDGLFWTPIDLSDQDNAKSFTMYK